MLFFQTYYDFIPLRFKYCPQYPVLRLPQSVFLAQCETMFHAHIIFIHLHSKKYRELLYLIRVVL
jgi:hypothetical protein